MRNSPMTENPCAQFWLVNAFSHSEQAMRLSFALIWYQVTFTITQKRQWSIIYSNTPMSTQLFKEATHRNSMSMPVLSDAQWVTREMKKPLIWRHFPVVLLILFHAQSSWRSSSNGDWQRNRRKGVYDRCFGSVRRTRRESHLRGTNCGVRKTFLKG